MIDLVRERSFQPLFIVVVTAPQRDIANRQSKPSDVPNENEPVDKIMIGIGNSEELNRLLRQQAENARAREREAERNRARQAEEAAREEQRRIEQENLRRRGTRY